MIPIALRRLTVPSTFYQASEKIAPWIGYVSILLLLIGTFWGLFFSPDDFRQGDAYRIMYIHVPSAWFSLFIYAMMAGFGLMGLIYRIVLADALARASAHVGLIFTALALVTGSIWGKPMWGSWWVWDARLTSELVLLFLYLGYIALQDVIKDRRSAARAGAVLNIIGLIDLPIIHFSVNWWSTLHQQSSVLRIDGPTMPPSMLVPLLVMTTGFLFFLSYIIIKRTNNELLLMEEDTKWVKQIIASSSKETYKVE